MHDLTTPTTLTLDICVHPWAALGEFLHPSNSVSLSWNSLCMSSVMKAKVLIFPNGRRNQNLPLVFPAQTSIHQSSHLTLAEAQKQLFSFWSPSICIEGTWLRTKEWGELINLPSLNDINLLEGNGSGNRGTLKNFCLNLERIKNKDILWNGRGTLSWYYTAW